MSVRELLGERVAAVAAERGLQEHRAFGYWFLEEMEDHSPEEALHIVVDGPWDGGRDGVAWDPDEGRLTIYQFKHSESTPYVLAGFADLETGLANQLADIARGAVPDGPTSLAEIRSVRLAIVSKCSDHGRLEEEVERRRRNLRAWRTRQGHGFEVDLENIDLRYFMQAFDRLFGVDTDLAFVGTPVTRDRGEHRVHLGLLDLRSLVPHIRDESLIYFNIRSFLGVRRGSINEAIRETASDPDRRDDFWLYNNGIVCLCAGMRRSRADGTWRARTLTIVNGAQTVNTVGRFLEDNPLAAEEPIPVVAKIIEVDEEDLVLAREITKTSNSQTPTSNRELRAVDPLHLALRTWFEERGWSYVFRRGDRHQPGLARLSMKEVAQAQLAFWEARPHIAFARPGTIFADDALYTAAFEPEEVMRLRTHGDEEQIAAYVDRRLLACRTLAAVRTLIEARGDTLDRSWRSLTYHLVWIIGEILRPLGVSQALDALDAAIAASGDDLLDGLVEFVTIRGLPVPKSMKSPDLAAQMAEGGFWQLPRVGAAINRMRPISTGS